MPANIELSGMKVSLVNAISRGKILKQYLDGIKRQYDYVFLDCMPSLGKLGIGGSVNSLVRNFGQYWGIVLSTTFLYCFMSSKIGHTVTDYIKGIVI